MDIEDLLHQSPPSPTHQAIMSMVDNYTHFESVYRDYPEAAAPVLEQVNALRAALEAFRIAVDTNTGTNPFEEEKTESRGAETPETTVQENEQSEPTEPAAPYDEEAEPAAAPICKEESITVVLPLQSEYNLELPFTDKALELDTSVLNDPITDPESVEPVEPIAQEASLTSTGPSGCAGHDSNPQSTDGPIALSTQEENSDL